mmetsp:Transcript_51732/g.123124  ORF Transcript_51732/g.123124 Transcript_51732/m.123124 type:complete len:260 (-) Transcript_51732:92-871(-)|eukprot:CAMPEP_0178409550 /NCGR_PEP_ID=MMETSP0689_2-20121128/20521_1 /TAXON_ID=160604 /ORGANISM="Amphidinium massartii, Strain CS-259" /LENGTH=259 /DNA_ID=CAMNT_0020030697 /DNA_START=69 /DNA_END=848 /DNA_ORIENTATION=-
MVDSGRYQKVVPELTPQQFSEWCESIGKHQIVHLKGFGSDCRSDFDEEAVAELARYSLLVWDGDPCDSRSFTRLVPRYLAASPSGCVAAFRLSGGKSLEYFHESWRSIALEFPDRVVVVPVNLTVPSVAHGLSFNIAEELLHVQLDGAAATVQQYFLLGRYALRCTGSEQVVALGGGAVAAKEAEAALMEDSHWRIYALTRGRAEKFPTLLDWAEKQTAGNASITLVRVPSELQVTPGTNEPQLGPVEPPCSRRWRSKP